MRYLKTPHMAICFFFFGFRYLRSFIRYGNWINFCVEDFSFFDFQYFDFWKYFPLQQPHPIIFLRDRQKAITSQRTRCQQHFEKIGLQRWWLRHLCRQKTTDRTTSNTNPVVYEIVVCLFLFWFFLYCFLPTLSALWRRQRRTACLPASLMELQSNQAIKSIKHL